MTDFTPHRISLVDARPGDILLWRGEGHPSQSLAWLIWKVKEPDYDKWGWHMTPVVYRGSQTAINQWLVACGQPPIKFTTTSEIDYSVLADAQFPKVRISILETEYVAKGRVCRAYRVVENEPLPLKTIQFVRYHVGRPYNWISYGLRALRCFWDIPRIIIKWFDCWDTTFDAMECWGADPLAGSDFDLDYPWLMDFLRSVGEIPLKVR